MKLRHESENSKTHILLILAYCMLLNLGCDSSYKTKEKGTRESISFMKQQAVPYIQWGVNEIEKVLEVESTDRIRAGVIVFAHCGYFETRSNTNCYEFVVKYLCGAADVVRVQITDKKGGLVALAPNSWLKQCAKQTEDRSLLFVERFVWSECDNPLRQLDADNLSVTLVRENGECIGPECVLANNEVIERVRLFVEREGPPDLH